MLLRLLRIGFGVLTLVALAVNLEKRPRRGARLPGRELLQLFHRAEQRARGRRADRDGRRRPPLAVAWLGNVRRR
jgi:hypothetical protein